MSLAAKFHDRTQLRSLQNSQLCAPAPMGLVDSRLGVRIVHDGISLNLDHPLGVDEARHLHNRVGRANVAEVLAVDGRHGLPVVDAGQQNPGAHDLRQ